jgi:hypothetical protein
MVALMNLPTTLTTEVFNLLRKRINNKFKFNSAVLNNDSYMTMKSARTLKNPDFMKTVEKKLFKKKKDGEPFDVFCTMNRYYFQQGSSNSKQFLRDLIQAG